jgi:hypothetical protein
MDLPELIHRLASPSAYPFRVDRTEVRQTHISVVFLANDVVYKLKKPLNLGFLDFSTIDKRRHFCEEEVRLNRRLAPDVYLGVVPITTGDSLQFEGTGSIVDWAVKMTRLPDSQTLESLLRQQRLSTEMLQTFARRLAEFHRNAERSKAISAFGQLEVVARNAIENFEQTASHVDVTVQRSVYDRLQWLTQYSLTQLGLLIENRSHRGVPCDTHGDLRLDHVYYFADRKPPSDWIVIDCIEFNKRFRYADPVADVAFLAMDLVFRHRRDLARAFANEWFDASYDDEGRSLLPFYMAYRSIVRAKVEGFKLTEPEIPELQRETAKRRSQSHWLLALGELAPPIERPALLLVGGLPGTGKSTLAANLAPWGFTCIRSDVIRKELAGIRPGKQSAAAPGEGIYTQHWSDRTYGECLDRARQLLLEGRRVIVDATFHHNGRRLPFLDLAKQLSIPFLFVICHAPDDVARTRIVRRRHDASDATIAVRELLSTHWEPPNNMLLPMTHTVATDGLPEAATEDVKRLLRENGLCP